METFTDSEDEPMLEGVPFGRDAEGIPEYTDNVLVPDDQLRQFFNFNVAQSHEERAANPSYAIKAQQLFGIHTDKTFLIPPITVPHPSVTPGVPYVKMREGIKTKAKIDRPKFNQFIADFVHEAELQEKADTVILIIDNRPFETIAKKNPWAAHCATRMIQRTKLQVKERTMVAFCHVGAQSGLSRVNPCFLTPIVLAALRALPHLDHVNLVGSDLDIFQNGVVDVQQQVEFMMPILKRHLRVLEGAETKIGLFWFSETRLQNNSGRLVCPAVSSDLQMNLQPLTAEVVGQSIDGARKGLWETRCSLEQLLGKLKTQVDVESAYTLMGTRMAMMRGLGKTPIREVAPETPAQVCALLAILCEVYTTLNFPPTGEWTPYSMKTPFLGWMTLGAQRRVTTNMISWGMTPGEQPLLEIVSDLSLPGCKAFCAPGPGLYMDLAPHPRDIVKVVGADAFHAYGTDHTRVDTKTYLTQYALDRSFFTLSQIFFGTNNMKPCVCANTWQISTGLSVRGFPEVCLSSPSQEVRIKEPSSFGFPDYLQTDLAPEVATSLLEERTPVDMEVYCHGLSEEAAFVGPSVLYNNNKYNGEKIYSTSGQSTSQAGAPINTNDHIRQAMTLFFNEPAMQEALVREAQRVGIDSAHILIDRVHMPAISIPPYQCFGHLEVVIALQRLTQVIAKISQQVTFYGHSAGAGNALELECALIALRPKPQPVSRVGAWAGSHMQLCLPKGSSSNDRDCILIMASQDQLCPIGDAYEEAWGQICEREGIQLGIFDEGEDADHSGYLGSGSHCFAYLLTKHELSSVLNNGINNIGNAISQTGSAKHLQLDMLVRLGVAAPIIERKKYCYGVLTLMTQKNLTEVSHEQLLTMKGSSEGQPVLPLPFHALTEKLEPAENFEAIIEVFNRDWSSLPEGLRKLFEYRVGPEIVGSDVLTIEGTKGLHRLKATAYTEELTTKYQYWPAGPHCLTFSFDFEQKTPWAYFTPPRDSKQKHPEEGVRTWQFLEIAISVPLQQVEESLAAIKGNWVNIKVDKSDNQELVEITLRGIVSNSYSYDERSLRNEDGELAHPTRPCIKHIELLVVWPIPTITNLYHDFFLSFSANTVKVTKAARTSSMIGQYWPALLRRLKGHRFKFFAGFPVQMTSEEADDRPTKGEGRGKQKGHYRFVSDDSIPHGPMPVQFHRARNAFTTFYGLVLESLNNQDLEWGLLKVYQTCLNVEEVRKIFTNMNYRQYIPELGETITTASVLDVLHHLDLLFKNGKPIGFITGLGGAGKSYSLAVALFLFTTWANSGVMDSTPFRILVTGPRITSLQTWVEQALCLASPSEGFRLQVDLLKDKDCRFIRILPTHFAENEENVYKNELDPPPTLKKQLFQSNRVKKGGGPWVVFASVGSAKSIWADLQAYATWFDNLDMAVGEEAQQLGHPDSLALLSVIPEEAMVVLVGDSKQQAHIGNQRQKGSRQTTAALEAAKAAIRGSMLPLPTEELDRIQFEAVQGLIPERDRTDYLHFVGDTVKRKTILYKILQDSVLAEKASAALYRYTKGREPGLLLLRSERLRYCPYFAYLLGESYRKVLPKPEPMTMPNLHPAAGRGWKQFRVGNVAQAQMDKPMLFDLSGLPLWELQLFRFDTQVLSDAGVEVAAARPGGRHFYLEVLAACTFNVWIWKIAAVSKFITQYSPFVVLSTHTSFLEQLKQVAFGSGQLAFSFQGNGDKKESKEENPLEKGRIFDGWISLHDVIQNEFPNDYAEFSLNC